MATNSQGGSGMAHGGEGVGKAPSRDRGMVLSTLWIFALINYMWADIFSLFFNPAAQAEPAAWTDGSLLMFAVLIETAVVMVLLSRILKRGLNRWLNIIVGAVQTAFVTWSLFGQAPKPFYVFFVSIEVVSFLAIIVYAWRWKRERAPQA